MARKRMIDPGFWTDEKLGTCSRDERLLFMALISNADDEGRLQGHSALIKSVAFPYDDIKIKDVENWLASLNKKRLILIYQVEGQTYIQIINFLKYQTINRSTPSKYPSPTADKESFTEDSLMTHEQLTDDSLLIEENRREVKEKRKEEKIMYAENVLLTKEEYQKLLGTHGEDDTKRLIEILDNYKGASGKKYKDDYRAILNWVIKRLEEDRTRAAPRGQAQQQPLKGLASLEAWKQKKESEIS